MKEYFIVFMGEIKKQFRNYQSSITHVFSLLIWPVLVYFTTLYTYHSFDVSLLNRFGILNTNDLRIFLVTGSLGYSCFWAMLESSLYLGKERENGTLEIVFMTPANKLCVLYGRALGGILQSTVLFIAFTIYIIVSNVDNPVKFLGLILLALVILFITSLIWGAFISSLFLLSRDLDIIFTICDEPMSLFSGVKAPVSGFPTCFQSISAFFPLTHCLIIIRSIFNQNQLDIKITDVFIFCSILLILIISTYIILKISIIQNRKTGNLQLY